MYGLRGSVTIAVVGCWLLLVAFCAMTNVGSGEGEKEGKDGQNLKPERQDTFA